MQRLVREQVERMANGSVDRRVSRTRSALQQALNGLILKKGYEATSIGDICAAADVGRSTFYAHFKNKDDLKRSGLEPLHKFLHTQQNETLGLRKGDAHPFAFSLAMFEHARDYSQHYHALVGGRGGTVSLAKIREILSDLVRCDLAITADRPLSRAMPRDFVVQYVGGAFMSVLTWWLDGGAKQPPHEMDAMFRALVTKGIGLAKASCG